MAHYFPLVGDHGAGLPPLHPLVFQPPPPPPPRSATNSSRRTSSFDGSTGPFDRMLMAGPAQHTNQSQHTYERPRSSSAMSSHSQDAEGEAQKCSRCGDMQEAMQRLEAKLALHITRVEMESQSALKAVIAEVNKLKQDREAAWKHVAELKEQNRLIRQRAFELEKQNGQFTMHIATLQERLCAFTEVAGQLQMLQGAAPPASNSLMPSMPKVPHSGADIW